MRLIAVAVATLSCGLVTACEGARSPSDEVSVERACTGLPGAEVDRVIDDLRTNVERVEPLRDSKNGPKAQPQLVGALIEVRATPGTTEQWLGRVLECDRVRHGGPEDGSLLAPAGARAEVTATPTGFAIAIRSRDSAVAHEIERKASAFSRAPAMPPQ
jgi:hypothetical protein